jgi:hypothetical protein
MTLAPLVPRGDALRHAVAWLAAHGAWTPALVEEACRQFDLGPADEEFLLGECRRMRAQEKR